MPGTQHTEATRKKLREAEFFLHRLASVDKGTVITAHPEAPDFYLSAFLSAARAVHFALHKERTEEWDAWIDGWLSTRSGDQIARYKFLVDQRNKVHKQGGPELTYTITPVSVFDFMCEINPRKGMVYGFNTPGLPPTTFSKVEKAFTAIPGQSLAVACQPLFDVMRELVEDFERDHPPA